LAVSKLTFKREHLCPAAQQSKGPRLGYIIDHTIALKRGWADTPVNMQWQTVDEAMTKNC
jgi:hypothetical protein